jgi:hypothetical protein
MKRMHVILILLASAILLLTLVKNLSKEDPVCVKILTKLELSDDFCLGLAERAAMERCGKLSDEEEVIGNCVRVIAPAAFSGCMDYLGHEKNRKEYESLCR